MAIFGALGYLMRELDYPTAPVVLALVLGPLMETAFRQSLIISQGSFVDFLTRPICAVLLLLATALVVGPPLLRLAARRERPLAEAASAEG